MYKMYPSILPFFVVLHASNDIKAVVSHIHSTSCSADFNGFFPIKNNVILFFEKSRMSKYGDYWRFKRQRLISKIYIYINDNYAIR